VRDDRLTRRQVLRGGLAGGVALGVGGGLLAACGGGGSSGGRGGGTSITFAGYGGTTQDAQVDAWGKTYSEATGGKVVATGVDYGKLKGMVESGNVTWDAAVVEGFFAHTAGNQDLFEPLQKSALDKSRLDAVAGYGPEGDQVTDRSIACYTYCFCMGYRTDNNGGSHPGNWTEFFDLDKFPGTRGLYGVPYGMIEIALLGDGVTWDQMYPLDVGRALKKIKSLGSDVKYWTSGADSQQMLVGGSADYVVVWDTRTAVLTLEGRPVATEFADNVRTADHLIVPKGSKKAKAGMQFLNAAVSPEAQAAIANKIALAPSNPDSQSKISKKSNDLMASGHVDESAGYIDNEFWGKNYDSILEKFNSVVVT
jgi:putative spermidine/putrescine transport system substrate-binding protein